MRSWAEAQRDVVVRYIAAYLECIPIESLLVKGLFPPQPGRSTNGPIAFTGLRSIR
jgi:hypothetical protein